MVRYTFTLTTHDLSRPWIVVSMERHTVELEAGEDFGRWAAKQWPGPEFTVELDPRLDTWRPA